MRALLLLLALATPLAAQETDGAGAPRLRDPDHMRFVDLDPLLGETVLRALEGAAPDDVAVLTAALAGEPGELDPVGDWSCRTLKLGVFDTPLIVYPPFRCRITATPGGWRIEKLTGSQLLAGEIVTVDGGTIYTGVGYVAGGPATDYAGLPPVSQEPVEPGQTHAQVGRFEQAGPDQARLLLPDPILESRFDILWLTR